MLEIPSGISFDGNYNSYFLENGARVGLLRKPTNTIFGTIDFDVGSAHDEKGYEGNAHLDEHGVFRGGSKRFPNLEADRFIAKFLEFNPQTDVHRTSYSAHMLPGAFETFLHFISDLVFNPVFEPIRVERERGKILREFAEQKSNPEFVDNREYGAALYGDHLLAMDVAGTENVVRRLSIDDLARFHGKWYYANNMRIIFAGPLPHDAERMIHQYFGNKPMNNIKRVEIPPVSPLEHRVILHREALDLVDEDYPEESAAAIKLGVLVPHYGSPYSHIVSVMAHSLVAFTESRLYKSISDRAGLAYAVSGEHDGRYNQGVLEIRIPVNANHVKKAIDAIFAEFRRLQETPLSAEELGDVQNSIIGQLAAKLDTSQQNVKAVTRHFDYGSTPEAFARKIASVNSEDIVDAARKFLPKSFEDGRYIILVRDPFYSRNHPII